MDTENEALIQDMIQRAEKADEPGDLNKVVRRGNEDDTPPTIVTTLKSAGYSYIYDTETRERSLINNNMLPQALKKKRANGSSVFTAIKPSEPPKRGVYKCTLHPANPNREYYDSLGLPVCPKANLTSPFQVKRHMQKRHRMEHEALEEERLQAEKDRSTKLQESLIIAVGGKMPAPVAIPSESIMTTDEPELYVSDHPYKSKKKR